MTTSRRKPFLIVSDLHLGAVPAETERRFRAFLDYATSEASGLLINGDLFEFGIAHRSVVPRGHVRVLAKLADVVESGVPVFFVAGNHDRLEWGGHVLKEDAGVTLLADPIVMEIAGRRIGQIEHGLESELHREQVPWHQLVDRDTRSFSAADELPECGLRV